MVEACSEAIGTGREQRVRRQHETSSADYESEVEWLAAAVSAGFCQDHSTGSFEGAFAVLTEELCRRVKELSEYTTKLRRQAA